jgi:L,D-peptidoglycan transpeptidase YkuD (ErfK/YbiS/YcfS/YnhG family)
MKRNVIGIGIAAVLLAGIAAAVMLAVRESAPSDPLRGRGQLLLVLSRTEAASAARIMAFDRDGDTWRLRTAAPAAIGENGMAWAPGLHRDSDAGTEPAKAEDDGRTPRGAFELLDAYGTAPRFAVNIRFPYTQITPDMACIDDPRDPACGRIVSGREEGEGHTLARGDGLYRYLVRIGVNPEGQPGAGCCVFLHLWKDERTPTDGSTAVSEETMLEILGWLDPAEHPVLVQLTRSSYRRLREAWGLPEVTL